ncbi:hscarg protein [Naematelia encephala]|uniref:Hscarg protein n=1 Tax=Naematelia encephala TaxID=71784 RepID=A0A1Y2B9N3_9TREE|nr:hscarg protein [Naematelia encephala]
MSKIVVILGATGKQGGSVINSILSDPTAKPHFSLRAITRDTSKPAAKALADRGVEMVAADLDHKDSLIKAFQGAYAVFAVTDYWNTLSKDVEIQQGKNIADAAKTTGVEHFIFSTLINATKATGGKLSGIEHFDSKATVTDYVISLGLPATFWLPGYYMSNLPGQGLRKDESTGKYVLSTPNKPESKFPLIDIVNDTGKFIKAILLDREGTLGKHILGASGYYSPQQIIDGFAKVFPKDGEGIKFVTVPDDAYKNALLSNGMPDRVAEEILQNMHLLNDDYGYYSKEPLEESIKIVKEPLVSWEEFLKNTPAFKDLK